MHRLMATDPWLTEPGPVGMAVRVDPSPIVSDNWLVV